jgi:hypothetical protein
MNPFDLELSDLLNNWIGLPAVVTLAQIVAAASEDESRFGLISWRLTNRRVIGRTLAKQGYRSMGLWRIGGTRVVVYGSTAIPEADRLSAAQALTGRP